MLPHTVAFFLFAQELQVLPPVSTQLSGPCLHTHTFTHLVVLLKCPQSGEDDECRQESRLMEVM